MVTSANPFTASTRTRQLIRQPFLEPKHCHHRDARLVTVRAENALVIIKESAVAMREFPERERFALLESNVPIQVRDQARLNKPKQVRPCMEFQSESKRRAEAQRL